MSSIEGESHNADEVEEVSVSPELPGAVVVPRSSTSLSLPPSSLPIISYPSRLPPRSKPSQSTPSVPEPQGLFSASALPPFSPPSPRPYLHPPTLQITPLVTPDSSPTRQGSVIFCPSSCELRYHQTPVSSLQPDHIRPSRRLGSKLIQKYIKKIPVVSASVSSLEPDLSQPVPHQGGSVNLVDEVFDDASSKKEKSVSMDAASRDLRRKLQLVKDHIGDLVEEDIDELLVPTVEGDLERIQRERDEYRSGVQDFVEDFADALDTAAQTTWQDSITSLNRQVKEHARRIRAKVKEICPPLKPLSEFEKTQLEIQMKQLQIMQTNANKDRDNKILRESSEKTRTLALAKKKYDAFFEVSAPLVDLSTKYPIQNLSDPKKCPDPDISALMRNISSWKNSVKDITRDYNAFQELTIVHRLEENLMENIDLEMENARNAVNDLIVAVEKEDKDRNIRTLDSSKAEQRVFKKFGGTPGED